MRFRALLILALLAPFGLQAGPIYGSIFMNGSALRGATVEVFNGKASQGKGQTLDDGSYRVKVGAEGRFVLVVTINNIRASAEVISSGYAARYNFVVVKGGGGYELRRQ